MIYFIQAPSGPVKIGFTSTSVMSRFRTIQTNHPEKLMLLGKMDGGKFNEKALHERFKDHRLSGEWFSPHPDIMALTVGLEDAEESSQTLNVRYPHDMLRWLRSEGKRRDRSAAYMVKLAISEMMAREGVSIDPDEVG